MQCRVSVLIGLCSFLSLTNIQPAAKQSRVKIALTIRLVHVICVCTQEGCWPENKLTQVDRLPDSFTLPAHARDHTTLNSYHLGKYDSTCACQRLPSLYSPHYGFAKTANDNWKWPRDRRIYLPFEINFEIAFSGTFWRIVQNETSFQCLSTYRNSSRTSLSL